MAKKKKSNSKGKKEVIKKGDDVYKKDDQIYCKWRYKGEHLINGENLAYITTVIPNMNKPEQDKCLLDYVPKSTLTKKAPPTSPLMIFVG